ncbi:MAG: mechanosensitive ion channel [Bacteroidetes bacterium]|nr:mechanosensitive ion channel [Bacteroidota bacterium]MBU1679398.1 mechanosensitive ion channel [Bacteroidota bacterium]MBU2505571.1 mechanosensitive ion channel [Bacteroidota bacterium]
MEKILNQIYELVGSYIPNLFGSLAILIFGWLAAWIVSSFIHRLLRKSKLSQKMGGWFEDHEDEKVVNIEKWISKTIFWLLMIFVLIAFFQTLKLTVVTEPLNKLLTEIFEYLPQLLGAFILLIVAWLVATLVRFLIVKLLKVAKLDEKLLSQPGMEEVEKAPISKALSETVYWLIFLLFLPAILGSLKLEGILQPIQGMLNEILAFLPNLFSAAIILFVGWFVARIIYRIVSSVLAAAGTDALGEKIGFGAVSGSKKLSKIIGLILYVIIMIPVIIAALNSLSLDSLTQPASSMLGQIMSSIPSIFAAIVLVTISYAVAKILSGFVSQLLTNIGFNKVVGKLGFAGVPDSSKNSPSNIVGYILMIVILLFASMEAFALLGFQGMKTIIAQLIYFGGKMLLGILIFGLGLFVANLAVNTINATKVKHADLLSIFARISILIFAGAMALGEMGLANEIIVLAFGLLFGSVAVAFAIAFGIGGRDLASKKLEDWNKKLVE